MVDGVGEGVGVGGNLALMASSSALARERSLLSGPKRLIAFCRTAEALT